MMNYYLEFLFPEKRGSLHRSLRRMRTEKGLPIFVRSKTCSMNGSGERYKPQGKGQAKAKFAQVDSVSAPAAPHQYRNTRNQKQADNRRGNPWPDSGRFLTFIHGRERGRLITRILIAEKSSHRGFINFK